MVSFAKEKEKLSSPSQQEENMNGSFLAITHRVVNVKQFQTVTLDQENYIAW